MITALKKESTATETIAADHKERKRMKRRGYKREKRRKEKKREQRWRGPKAVVVTKWGMMSVGLHRCAA